MHAGLTGKQSVESDSIKSMTRPESALAQVAENTWPVAAPRSSSGQLKLLHSKPSRSGFLAMPMFKRRSEI
jgi:hypothetical protein